MDLLTKENILSDNKIDLVIGDTHGDFTAILNVLNSYLKTNIKFQYYEDLTLTTINNYITINTSLMKHKDFINSNEKFIFEGLNEKKKEEKKEEEKEINQEIKPEINQEIKPEINSEIKPEINQEINQEIKSEINKEINQEIKPEINQEINSEINQETKPEINQEIKPEINQEIKPEINSEIKPEINPEINQEINQEIKPEINQEINQETNISKQSLNNVRLIILGDIFDTNNYLTLRTRGEKNKIEFKPLNTDAVIEYTDKYKIFGNFVCDYNNIFFLLCQQLVYKLLVSLEDYIEIKYIFGNHELSSFNYYPENIQDFIINKFRTYYYNKTYNTFYCHFYNKTDKTEINDIKHNTLNIDELILNTLKDYKTAAKNKKNKFYFKLMNLKKSLIQVVDMDIIDKLENKYEIMGNSDKIIMKHKSIFDSFIKELKPVCFVGHWNMNETNVNKDKTIYFLDRDLSIIHARTIQNKITEKIGIILNCQYCVINKENIFDENVDKNINSEIKIKHIVPLFDYEFYVNDPLESEYITEQDYNKYVIFDLRNALILDF